MPDNLSEITLAEYISGVNSGEFSPQEVQKSVLSSIAQKDGEIHAFLDVQEAVPEKSSEGRLLGAPIAVKDNILVPGLHCTASSRVLDGYMPQYSASLIEHLQKDGGWVVGKTNMDAWAHGSSTETSDFGSTKNPRNTAYIPGGSSGGSAAALAANMTIAAIGTETSGSILGPAAWTGIVGLKPTYGRVSRYGVISMASSLDSPGPMTKTVEDAAILLGAIAGQDSYDSTSAAEPVPDYTRGLRNGLKGKKIGVIYESVLPDDVRPVLDAAVRELEKLGAIVSHVEAMDPTPAIGMYAVLQRSEVSSNLARFDGIRFGHGREMFGREAKRRIMLGTYTLSKGYADRYYVHAQKLRTLFIQDFQKLFSEHDLLVSLSLPRYAFPFGETQLHPYYGEIIDKLAEPRCAAGLPAISVPCFIDQKTNLPLGLSIIGPQFSEAELLTAAYAYEQATDWNPWVHRNG